MVKFWVRPPFAKSNKIHFSYVALTVDFSESPREKNKLQTKQQGLDFSQTRSHSSSEPKVKRAAITKSPSSYHKHCFPPNPSRLKRRWLMCDCVQKLTRSPDEMETIWKHALKDGLPPPDFSDPASVFKKFIQICKSHSDWRQAAVPGFNHCRTFRCWADKTEIRGNLRCNTTF